MTKEWKCPSCDGKNLTKPGAMKASGHSLHRQFALDDGSWLGGSVVVVAQGVVCLDCGHIMLYARPEDLQELRAKAHQLK